MSVFRSLSGMSQTLCFISVSMVRKASVFLYLHLIYLYYFFDCISILWYKRFIGYRYFIWQVLYYSILLKPREVQNSLLFWQLCHRKLIYTLCRMVHIDGNSEHVVHMWRKQVFVANKFQIIDKSVTPHLALAGRRGFRISVKGGRDFLGTKLFSGIRNKVQEKRYKTHIV